MTHSTIAGFANGWRCRLLWTIAVISACLVSFSTANAASICRWVDENGRVQFADVVPDRYKGLVSCTHSGPTVQNAERPTIRSDKRSPSAQAPAPAATAPFDTPRSPAKRPTQTVTSTTDCKTWQRLFNESGACFAPFRTTRGGVKAEAFEQCNDIPEPKEKCGPLSN